MEPNVEILTAVDAEAGQRRAAGALGAAGLQPGDRVAFCLSSSAALLCAVLGALRTGIVPVLLNATLVAKERESLLADADPMLVIADEAALARLDAGPAVALAPHPLGRPMHYTSGTTGRAKGVWSGIWDEAMAAEAFGDEADLWSFGPDDIHLVCSPMYHSVSIRFAAGTLLRGGTCVIVKHFDGPTALQALKGQFGLVPTTAFLAPTALHRMLRSQAELPARFEAIRLLAHAGSPCPPTVKRQAMALFPEGSVWEFLGSTEGQFTVCSPHDWLAHPGTVGKARPRRTLSVDDDGMVWCQAPEFCRFEYWGDEAKTAAAWRGDAFTVGDLGTLDAEGFLTLDGRRDDLIISGGVNVYPADVESVLGEIPGIWEIAVFGLDDETWGQQVCAAIVVDPAVGDRGAAIIDAARAKASTDLAPYKRPKQYQIVDELPHTATGKLQRHVLADGLGFPVPDHSARISP